LAAAGGAATSAEAAAAIVVVLRSSDDDGAAARSGALAPLPRADAADATSVAGRSRRAHAWRAGCIVVVGFFLLAAGVVAVRPDGTIMVLLRCWGSEQLRARD
jgi:hypothetical protein